MYPWLAFGLAVVCAMFAHWEARDLIWGLWISSLTIGYALIVKNILAGVLATPGPLRLLAAGGGVFLLAFFTFHFGMFHFVHSVFLNLFFPLAGNSQHGFPDIFSTIARTLSLYWPFVLANFIYKLPDFRLAAPDLRSKDAFAAPYANVVRIQILIFVFAGMAALRIDRFAIYPILIFFYFPFHKHFLKDQQ